MRTGVLSSFGSEDRVTKLTFKIDGGSGDECVGVAFCRADVAAMAGTPQTDEKGVPQIEQHPYRHLVRQKEQTSSSLAVVVRAVQETIGPIDNDTARRILENCYQRVPDATDDELDHYVRLTAFRIRKSTRVQWPPGDIKR